MLTMLREDPPVDEGPFHRHSTLLGLLAAFVVVAVLGLLTHWSAELIAVYILGFPISFVLFTRAFYGLRASRKLDKEHVLPDSGPYPQYDIDLPGIELGRAYEQAQNGDPSHLKRLAELEQSRQQGR